jgi:hypothetical protein
MVEKSSPLLTSPFSLLLVSPSFYPRSGPRATLARGMGCGLGRGFKGE